MDRRAQFAFLGFGAVLLISFAYTLGGQKSPPVSGEPMVAVTVPDLDTNTKLGERLFNENCASCHGKNAAGQDGVAPPLVHKIYEPNHHGDGSFLNAAMSGVRAHHWPFGDMPPVEGVTEKDVAMIVAYVRSLQRANGIN
ncbi:MAG: cytochrome c [Roseibium sp.]